MTNESVAKLRNLKVATCVDLMPIDLFRAIFPTVIPAVTTIINTSISTGVFPSCLKQAVITPIIKSQNLDSSSLSSYRPVSILLYLSKLLETAVANQLVSFIEHEKLLHSNQSAYRKLHSVETALLSISSNILEALDGGSSVYLLLLDLSAAFDTVDHNRLLSVLKNEF